MFFRESSTLEKESTFKNKTNAESTPRPQPHPAATTTGCGRVQSEGQMDKRTCFLNKEEPPKPSLNCPSQEVSCPWDKISEVTHIICLARDGDIGWGDYSVCSSKLLSPLHSLEVLLFQKRMVLEGAPAMTHSELILGKSITMETANHS